MLLQTKNLTFALCVLFTIIINAQNEASNWYFGDNAGIYFDTDTGLATPLNNGSLSTEEGCASISDFDGNLLFYTDGRTVYNSVHTVMQNGSGLKGDASSTQSAIIVPKPGSTTIYYIFTVDTPAIDNIDLGFNYFEVDMSLDGGLGAVVNNSGTQLLSNTSEKLSAVLKDCESQDIWVITFGDLNGGEDNNSFFAYKITDSGVSLRPIISTFNISITEIRGYLKFSPSGTQIACANVGQGVLLLDFDLETGVASNLKTITPNLRSPNGQAQQGYGIEFSPDSQLLYIASYSTIGGSNNAPGSQYGALLQYNLNAANIDASEIVLDERQTYRSGLQLGPDGKLYRSMSASYSIGSPFLSVVDNPNTLGVNSNYRHNAIALSGNSRQGLPPFITSFFSNKIDIIQNGMTSINLPLCVGDRYTLMAEDNANAIYTWYKDGTLLAETDFDLEIASPGFYQVYIELTGESCGTLEGDANVTYSELPIAIDSDLFQCNNQTATSGFTLFKLSEANTDLTGNLSNRSTSFFLTPENARNNTNAINEAAYRSTSNSEIIYVRVTNDITGCFDFATLTLRSSNSQIDRFIATPVCDEPDSEDGINMFNKEDFSEDILRGLPSGSTVNYYKTIDDALLENNPLPNSFENTMPYSEIIYSRVENNNVCFGINEVLLTVNMLPNLQEDETVFYCLNNFPTTITLDAGLNNSNLNNYSFSWSTSQNSQTIAINTVGTYSVRVTNNTTLCEKTRTIVVEPSNTATVETIEVVDSSLNNNQITVLVSGEGNYVYAIEGRDGNISPYQESNVFTQLPPGIFSIFVKDIKNNCGITNDKVSIIGFPLYFTPNNDGQNDTWQVYGVSSVFQPDSEILIFDRFGKLLQQINPSSTGWDGTFNGEPMPTSDYWFAVKLQDGRVYRNHFTLKR